MILEKRYEALLENKARLIAARRNGDDNLAAQLSQEKQKLKSGWCQVCGVAVARRNDRFARNRCRMHISTRLSQRAARWVSA